jgi:anaerobic selenocysteine-containing dehydrogenase
MNRLYAVESTPSITGSMADHRLRMRASEVEQLAVAVAQALAHAMNEALGNQGRTVVYTEPVEANPANQTESLRELAADMEAGRADLLVIVGANPVYTAPRDVQFAEKLDKAKLRVQLSLYEDETSAPCHWHIPEAHYLESWSDARACDGTITILQPLIAPLYDGKSAHELAGGSAWRAVTWWNCAIAAHRCGRPSGSRRARRTIR